MHVLEMRANELRRYADELSGMAKIFQATGGVTMTDVDLIGARRAVEYALLDIKRLCASRRVDERMAEPALQSESVQ